MSTEQEELKGLFASKATSVEKDLTVPGRTARGYEQRKGVDFLPRFLRSDINKKFLDATVDQLITNDSTRRLNSYYGSRSGLVNNPQQNFYQTSKNKLKEDYRFKPGIVTVNDDASTDVHITYDDIINRLEFLDADVSNLDSLFQDVNYIWRPIVNPDKLVNFSEYFWFQFDLPLCTVDGTFNPATDIIGKVEFTVPAFGGNSELVLQNGMMISFGPTIQAAFPGVYSFVDSSGLTQARQYIVEQVGCDITLIDTTNLSKKTPYTSRVPIAWDNLAWDTHPWDGSIDLPALKEYVVMERGTVDQNAWSRINSWYHINTIKAVFAYNNLVLQETTLNDIQAQRPIIEFHRDYHLWNYGDYARSNIVATVTDKDWLTLFIGSTTLTTLPDGINIVRDNDVLLIKDTNTAYDDKLWRVSGVGVGVTLTELFDTRNGSSAPMLGDKVLDLTTGYESYYDGTAWVVGQNKTERNSAILFDLMNHEGNYISDNINFPNSNFTGNTVFEYRRGTGPNDSELGFPVIYGQNSPANTTSAFANITFRFTQEFTKYRYNLDSTNDTIEGYYYVGTNATGWDDFGNPTTPINVSNGWERSTTVNRTELVKNIIIKNETSLSVDLGTESWGGSLNNQVEYEITDGDNGYRVWEKTAYTEHELFGTNPDIYIPRDQATSISYKSGVNPISIVSHTTGAVYTGGGVVGTNPSPFSNDVFTILPTSADPNILNYTGASGTGKIYIVDNGTQSHFPDVYYNGKLAKYGIDWEMNGNSVVLPLNNGIRQKRIVELKENDIIDIRYLSNEVVPNPTYEQNSSFVANPKNDTVTDITFVDYFDHFTTVIGNYNGLTGDKFGENNFDNLCYQSGVAGRIQQHENNALLYGPLFGNIEYSPINALRFTGDQVDRFRKKFKQTATAVYQSVPVGTPTYEIVDQTLARINVGKNQDFPFAFSNMVYSSNFTEQVETGDGIKTVYDLDTPIELGNFGQHIYVYVNDILQEVELQYTVTNTQVTFNTPPATVDTIKFRVPNKDALTLVPVSLPKIGLAEVYVPIYYTGIAIGPFAPTAPFIQYHDGALDFDVSEFDEVNLAILELERRIFNHINKDFKDDLMLHKILFASASRTPYADFPTVRAMAEQRFNTWLSSQGKTSADKAVSYLNTNYSASDPFSWNWRTVTPGSGPLASGKPGYWRGMYMFFFGAYEPAVTPWRCLGHSNKPIWWDTYYPSSTNMAWGLTDPKRIALIEAIRTGNTENPAVGVNYNPVFARPQYAQYLPVSAGGLTIDPLACGLVTSAPTTKDAAENFQFGDHYGLELDWRRTARYKFDLEELTMLLTPGTYMKDWESSHAYTTSLKGERVRKDTLKRDKPKDLEFHRYVNTENVTEFHYGINHLIIEYLMNRNQKFSNKLKDKVRNLDTKLLFKLEGFTSKNTIRLITDSTSQTSDRFVPEEDFDVTLYQSPPLVDFTMSSVTVIFDGVGYQVVGKNNVDPYFIIEPSRRNGRSVDVTVGDTTVVKYLDGTGVDQQVPYGTRFVKRSDVFDFFVSYQRYLAKTGWILDRTSNFERSAEAFIQFSNVLLDEGDNVELSPFKTGVRFDFTSKGFIGNTQSLLNEVYNLKDQNNREIKGSGVDVTRLDGEIRILPTGDQDIHFVRLYTTEFDHLVYLSQKTVFNDTLYDPLLNIKLDRIKFIGQRTADWNGVPKANGYVLSGEKLVTNFEKSVNDVDRGYFDVEDTVLNDAIIDAARHNIGYVTQEFLKNNLFNKDVSFEFYKGLIHKKGTPSAYSNLLRSINIDNDVRDIDVQEEWMLKLGEYGGLAVTQDYEVELPAGSIKHNPQLIEFVEDIRDDRVTNRDLDFDTKITITANDTRWVKKPNTVDTEIEFPFVTNEDSFMLSAGLAFETEVEYSLFKTRDLPLAYTGNVQPGSIPIWRNNTDIQAGEFVRYNGQVYVANRDSSGNAVNEANILDFQPVDEPHLPTYWIAKHTFRGKTDPNVLKAQDHGFAITEICAGIEEPDKALVKTDKAHNLSVGDKVLIVNSTTTPNIDGIHEVVSIENDTWFIIDMFIDKKGETGKFFPLREMMWDTKAELDALLTDPRYKLRTGDIGYTKDAVYKYNYGRWVAIRQKSTPVDTGAMLDVKIYDSDKDKIISTFEVLDPRKGIIPGKAQRELSITNPYDIAKYNSSNDTSFRPETKRFWAGPRVGLTWWDTSTAIYQNPEQTILSDSRSGRLDENKEYKYTHWGKLHPSASIDIYEWSRSIVSPDEWINQGGDGTPYHTIDDDGQRTYYWSEDFEYDKRTGQQKRFFYFWVKNRTAVPSMQNIDRELSASSIAQLIANPTTQGILWVGAPTRRDVLIGNADKILLDENSVFEFHFKQANQTNHSEFYIVREDDEQEIIPVYFHERLKASLVGRQFANQAVGFQEFDVADSYLFGEIVRFGGNFYRALANNPAQQFSLGNWEQLFDCVVRSEAAQLVSVRVRRLVPDLREHPLMRFGIEPRPAQAQFENIDEARRVLVQRANQLLLPINLVDTVIDWDRILKQTAFRPTNSNPAVTFDITKYWYFVNWKSPNWVATVPEKDVADFVALQAETPTNGRVIRVLDDGTGRFEIWLGDGQFWNLIEKQDATIQLSGKLWDLTEELSGWDMDSWDSDAWDEYPQTELFVILDTLRYDVFKDNLKVNYNKLWFTMLYYTFTDQKQVDWAYKTTYIQVKVKERGDAQANIYHGADIENVVNYVKTVKPFHTKLRNVFNVKEVDDETILQLEESRNMIIKLRFNRHGDPCWNQEMVDGANFWVLEPGWDQAPWEGVYSNLECLPETAERPWDADRTTLENLFLKDIYDGHNFGLPKTPVDDIIVEGDRFIHPEYEGYPEEQVNVLPFDAVSIRIQTNQGAANSVGDPATTLNFHMFKDMMGDFHIHRASDDHSSELLLPLNKGDRVISVADVTKFTQPDVVNNVPGVVWVGPERIEFWGVDTVTNELIDITRGTLGTPEVNHTAPKHRVYDAGRESEIPGVARYVNYGDFITPAYNNFNTSLHASSTPEARFIQEETGIIRDFWHTLEGTWTGTWTP